MSFEVDKIIDFFLGPNGGLIALGVLIGVKGTWKFFDLRSDKRYQENIEIIEKSAEEMKGYLVLEVKKLRQEMKEQDEACKRDSKELHSKIYELMERFNK